jgi:quercetin dioxygenase-like cupin family protein
MDRRVSLHRWEELRLETITEMVSQKAIVGAGATLVQAYVKKGALVHQHTHAAEQWLYVLQGALRAVVDGEETTVREGDVLQVAGGVAHQAEALDDTFLLIITGR